MSADPNVRLGEAIAKLREEADMAQNELAAAVGMSQSQISRLEKGTQETTLSKLSAVAAFFGLPVGRLIDGDIRGALGLPEVTIGRSVTCEEHGLVEAGLTSEAAVRVQAEHRRAHVAAGEVNR